MSEVIGVALENVAAGDPVLFRSFTTRAITPARWDSPSRNNPFDWNFPLLNLPTLSATRVDTQCMFCSKRIWRGQDRYKYSTPWSRIRRQNYFNLHQHCYYALIILNIEKLRGQLPSNMPSM